MKKNIVFTVVAALAVFGALFGYKFLQMRQAGRARAQMQPPAATVAVAVPRAENWHRSLVAVTTLQSREGVTVRTEVDGLVMRVAFTSGAAVKQGDPLVDLDTSREEAQLKGLLAAAQLAELSLNRARDLRANGTNSAADLDVAEATYAQAVAAADLVRVAIAKKHITAPFAGRLGITEISPGQYLRAGDPLVQLEALDPIYADFGVPQQDLPKVKAGLAVQVTIDAFPGRTFAATIEAFNPRVSDATRNVRVRALLPNRDELLQPGMFGHAEVQLAESQPVLVLPATAIVYNPYGNSVFVVENGVARQKFVQTGALRGDLIAILGGLEGNEQVVIAGALKLRNNMPAKIDNSVVPDANAAPAPKEG
ncbi:MAG TPA: efflux RND transporter periplasmic adaptor subunit [Opitutaceae bacterium]|nr:efflux RND transporter periplasmic adaptor subunit [Opitutaceae bacterium]